MQNDDLFNSIMIEEHVWPSGHDTSINILQLSLVIAAIPPESGKNLNIYFLMSPNKTT